MNQRLVSGTIFLAAIFFVTLIFYKKTKIDDYSVAIFVPAQHPAMDEIVQGFCDALKKRIPSVQYTICNGQGNKTLMQSQAEMIVTSGYGLVFTVGNSTSQLIHGLLRKRHIVLPHIFTAVDDPVEKHLVDSLTHPGHQITGVITPSRFDEQIDYLLMVKPTVKSILLAYDPTHPSNTADIAVLQALLDEKQIKLVLCPVVQTGEIKQKVSLMLDGIDAVLILKDHLLVVSVELLVRLCEERKIALYCSDLNSVDKGAAFAFGIYEREYGESAVDAAYQILAKKKDAGSIAIQEIPNFYFKMNIHAMALQGVVLDTIQLERLENQGVIVV
jgi:putative ABC transport system substrate-binding protein